MTCRQRRKFRSDDLLAIDDALGRLAELDPGTAELVKLRFFAGLTSGGSGGGSWHFASQPRNDTGPIAAAGLHAELTKSADD